MTPQAAARESGEPTLRQRTHHAIKTAILSGELPPGAQLNEAALAERLEVSRGPVREALRQLGTEGLVRTFPYRGSFVPELTLRDVEEIYSMRTVLESFAFKLAWPRRSNEFRVELASRHANLLETVDRGAFTAAIEAELHLHDLVYESADHAMLAQSWKTLRNKVQFYFAVHQRAHGRAGPARDGDDRYVELAAGEDLDAMLAEVYLHMRKGLERLRQYVGSASS